MPGGLVEHVWDGGGDEAEERESGGLAGAVGLGGHAVFGSVY